jgi:GH35 family endo-1,4-beta-xylanase
MLLINDFNLSPDYERLIETLLDRGCPIDVIGLQSHQHTGYHGVEFTQDVINRFARFGKPLHFTEATLVSGHLMPSYIEDLNDYKVEEWPSTPEGEERQRQQVEEYYACIYSRPEVAALVWWDMVDSGWLRAPSGLLRKDKELSPKPAYLRLQELIKGEWWFPETEMALSADLAIQITAPEGQYAIALNGKEYSVALEKSKQETRLVLPA